MSHQLEVSHHSTRPAKELTLIGVRDRCPSLHHLGLYKAGGFGWVGRCFLGEDSVCEKSSSILPLLGDGGGGMGLLLVQTGMRLNKPWQCLHNGEMDPSLPIWCPPSRPNHYWSAESREGKNSPLNPARTFRCQSWGAGEQGEPGGCRFAGNEEASSTGHRGRGGRGFLLAVSLKVSSLKGLPRPAKVAWHHSIPKGYGLRKWEGVLSLTVFGIFWT